MVVFRLDKVLEKSFEDIEPWQKVGVEVTHPKLMDSILHLFGDVGDTTTDSVMWRISEVQQSAKDLKFDDGMGIKVTIVNMPHGAGEYKRIFHTKSFDYF